MKLNIVPARTGIQWVKLGIRTFFKRPLALASLCFLYSGGFSLLLLVPYAGMVVALAVVPAATLGLMAATEEAASGRMPFPNVLLSGFRGGRARMRAMLALGLMYAALIIAVAALVPLLVDLPQANMEIDAELVQKPQFQLAMLVVALLYLPISLLFWHAPALVYWHGVSAIKSLFFSAVACWRNAGAMLVFALGWMAMFVLLMVIVGVTSAVSGRPEVVAAAIVPPGLLILFTMFSSSLYFTFRDSFVATPQDDPQPNGESP